ncbi:uncharacterized protein K452DRAFT_271195 [Aplosporella prunicola CBS 121167]|uniref:FAD-binding domain-containing protein n=1 Tax=Aplosporella prunicola CBS 121167 TaxID=1176127 RepID=A0A6A6BC18_9PEZI|nr:uncharacterized protein K452DRAFT_271195 [Aplosporella prunicola CBS 121167]KAF2141586.1 hypothetical protein K452DRAFT_271195 [Aplosporella prunicola CBS 121167]
MAAHDFKILIAGGSVAGLVLAIMLEKLGIDFLVLEGHSKIAPQVGASIGWFPNASRILDQLGCYDDLRAKITIPMGDMLLRTPEGGVLCHVNKLSEHFILRHGYDPVFVDRQMALEIFYNHINAKSKVLLHKQVVKVNTLEKGIEVATQDDSIYSGDMLVGANGVHSAVRQEMWRLGNELSPGYFAKSPADDIKCDYLCVFGISGPTESYITAANYNALGHGRSHVVIGGPEGRIYWFLFIKCDRTLHGLGKEIPRVFSKEEENALVEKFKDDPITNLVKFGDLYKNKIASVLTALLEFVQEKWHYDRIFILGDAVHKFNPISGQGGANAIETAAVLVTQLMTTLTQHPTPTTADLSAAFQTTQSLRLARVQDLVRAAHAEQSLSALETPLLKLMARLYVPLLGVEGALGKFSDAFVGGASLPMLLVPKRPRFEPYLDELPARPLQWKEVSASVAGVVFARLVVVARTEMGGVERGLLAGLGNLSTDATEVYRHTALLPSILIWTIEAYRAANVAGPISL